MQNEQLARLARLLVGAGRVVLDHLLPPSCACCEAEVDRAGAVCGDCFRELGFITRPFCRSCGVPFAHLAQGGPAGLCPACVEHPPLVREARAALRYDAASARLILPLKHTDRTELAGMLGQHMARAGAALLREADVLVPVPLHRRRLRARRYNQAALLARVVGRRADRPVLVDALLRRRPTPSLGEMGATERAAALADAIAVRPSRGAHIVGRHVLLIDDVLTSGATVNECARALLAAGAASVDVLVAARVPDPRIEAS